MNDDLVDTLAPSALAAWRPWRARFTGFAVGACLLALGSLLVPIFDAAESFEWLFASGFFISIAVAFVAFGAEHTMLKAVRKAHPDFLAPAFMTAPRAFAAAIHVVAAIAGDILGVETYGWPLL